MKKYIQLYDEATEKILKKAAEIDRFALNEFDAQYTLYDISYTLRDMYKNHLFRDRYVGTHQFNADVPYPKGFCALSSICIYELYGGTDIWTPSAIKLGTWEHAPVVFLRDNINGIAFDTTGDQFAPLVVPYEIGTPINKRMRDMKTPNKELFIKEIKNKLDRR